jgi:hypothetical protein
MSEPSAPLSLLNVFDVKTESGPRRFLCFVDPVIAGARGIDPRAIVGEFPPRLEHAHDPAQLTPNPGFIQTFILYMNEAAATTRGLADRASRSAGQALYVVDPRVSSSLAGEPPPQDVLGAFDVANDGTIVPGSFAYNQQHRWFDPRSGISGVFADRNFYDWLHPTDGGNPR